MKPPLWIRLPLGDNPQMQVIGVAPINVEIMGFELQDQEGKAIYSHELEYHNYSYLCTTENKETSEIDFMTKSNKAIKVKETQRGPNHQQWRGHD
jgi:hypothetical protein